MRGGSRMQLEMLYGKIHRATVTGAELDYEGSVGISRELVEAAGFHVGQKVLVANLSNANRFESYVILLEKPGQIVMNGAAAHLAKPGDVVIIMSFALMSEAEAAAFRPKVVMVDAENRMAGA